MYFFYLIQGVSVSHANFMLYQTKVFLTSFRQNNFFLYVHAIDPEWRHIKTYFLNPKNSIIYIYRSKIQGSLRFYFLFNEITITSRGFNLNTRYKKCWFTLCIENQNNKIILQHIATKLKNIAHIDRYYLCLFFIYTKWKLPYRFNFILT